MRAWRVALTALFLMALVPFVLTEALAGKGGKPPPEPLANPAVAFVRGYHVYVMDTSGTKQQVTSGAKSDRRGRSTPAWSPEGTAIAFLQDVTPESRDQDLYLVGPDGSNPTLVRTFAHPDLVVNPGERMSWLPDGARILCTIRSGGSGTEDLCAVDLIDGSTQALGLASFHNYLTGATVGPDLEPATPGYQGLICYAAREGIHTWQDLHVVEVTTAGDGGLQILPETITELSLPGQGQWQPAWSPDGTQIAFVEVDQAYEPPLRLSVVSFDAGTMSFGTPTVLIEREAGYDVHRPTWSPDGSWIAFGSTDAGYRDIFRIRPDGTGLTNMTNTARKSEFTADWNPAWVNDIGP